MNSNLKRYEFKLDRCKTQTNRFGFKLWQFFGQITAQQFESVWKTVWNCWTVTEVNTCLKIEYVLSWTE